ncbi:MAG: hypothetical protein FWD83_00290 [Promicromonosporaceae bacterium]|nr:hypothetical protein [Promicromonosporaceae bacterium]
MAPRIDPPPGVEMTRAGRREAAKTANKPGKTVSAAPAATMSSPVRASQRQVRSRRRARSAADALLRTAVVADVGARGRDAKRALRDEHARQSAALSKITGTTVTNTPLPTMPRRLRRGRWSRHRLWGPLSPGVPAHLTSSARMGVLSLMLAPRTMAIEGPIIGLETTSRQPWTHSPWGPVRAGSVTSPNVVVFGLQGSGKSMGVKICMVRYIEDGVQVIVSSDPKGEWIALAHALGGQVVSIGPGSGQVFNPLDEGIRPAGMAEHLWRQLVLTRRALALESIAETLRHGQTLNTREQACLDRVVEAIADGQVDATIRGVVYALQNPSREMLVEVGPDAPAELALVFGRLVRGPMAGMFDTESTVHIDPAAPMVVIDTSHLRGASPQIRAIASACSSAWIDATLRSMDGRWRCVVSEEGWDEIRNPAQAQAMDDRLRMTGHWRCSNWLIFHELADITQFGEAGSEHRNQVKGIITKSATKVLYRQSNEAMAMINEFVKPTAFEARHLTTLPQGVGMWHIGDDTPISVYPVAGPDLYRIINTDAGRFGT